VIIYLVQLKINKLNVKSMCIFAVVSVLIGDRTSLECICIWANLTSFHWGNPGFEPLADGTKLKNTLFAVIILPIQKRKIREREGR
jgi:hypothetical protein